MPAANDREFIPIEAKYFLTDDGMNYCGQRKIPYREIRQYRGTIVPGFTWSNVDSDLLERFVTHGLLAGMELERAEFLIKRPEIIRLIEVLFKGITLKRFRPLLKGRLLKEEAYRQILAKNISPEKIREILKAEERTVSQIKKHFNQRLIDQLVADNAVDPDHPEIYNKKSEKLLSLVDDTVYFLLVYAAKTKRWSSLSQIVSDFILSYYSRLDLSEYIALNLMEFIQMAESAHFMYLADKDLLLRSQKNDVATLVANPMFRERLINTARLQNEFLVLRMTFEGNPYDIQNQLMVEISVRNKGILSNQNRMDLLSKKDKVSITESFEDFYQGQGDSDGFGSMGFFNLSILKNLCEKQNISIETFLTRDERANETVAIMKLFL